jgi:hypothetical protein
MLERKHVLKELQEIYSLQVSKFTSYLGCYMLLLGCYSLSSSVVKCRVSCVVTLSSNMG